MASLPIPHAQAVELFPGCLPEVGTLTLHRLHLKMEIHKYSSCAGPGTRSCAGANVIQGG